MMQKLIGNFSKGLIFVLSAPAGTGKTTLVRMLSQEFPDIVGSISCTTRAPRANEKEGKDYHFLTESEFQLRVQRGDFLEFANVFGYHYGTSKEFVRQQQLQGRHVFLVIDTQGAQQLREQRFSAVYIFLSPPSFNILKERLIKRETDHIEVIEKRLAWATKEMAMISYYNYHIINDDLDQTYAILRSIVIAEAHRVQKDKDETL